VRVVVGLVAAAFKNPCGVTTISSCCVHGVFGPTTIVWFCVCSPASGCCPPPRGGFSNCMRSRVAWDALRSKSIDRVYDLTVNFGHGDVGLYACPNAKSYPDPVY